MLWFSLLVLIPLAAVSSPRPTAGWAGFWNAITNEQTRAAIRLTVGTALLVTVVNVVMGTLIAWVLVRDQFFGKRALEVLIDIPFALPTIVAGLVLLSLYGPNSPVGIDIANTPLGGVPGLPVRDPPLRGAHGAAGAGRARPRGGGGGRARSGASRFTTFRRIILPSLTPAIAAGAALSFARGVSEYGSLVLLSGNLPFKTEVTSVRILSSIENDNPAGAAAVATILLAISLAVIVAARPPAAAAGPPWLTSFHDLAGAAAPVAPTVGPRHPPVPGCRTLLRARRHRLPVPARGLAGLASWPTNTSPTASTTICGAARGPRHGPRLQAHGDRRGHRRWSSTPSSASASRSCWCATSSRASACSTPSSTCPCRCRRSSSACRWSSSTAAATAGSAPRSRAAGFQVIFATPGIVMATIFVALPLVIREVVPVLEEIGIEQEQAARSLGASALQTFRRITLPVDQVGRRSTASSSAWPGRWASSARSRWCRATSSAQTRTATLVVEEKYLNFDKAGRLRHRLPPGPGLGRLHRRRRHPPPQGRHHDLSRARSPLIDHGSRTLMSIEVRH